MEAVPTEGQGPRAWISTPPLSKAFFNRQLLSKALRGLVLSGIALVSGYAVMALYGDGEYLLAFIGIMLVTVGCYVYLQRGQMGYRFVFPATSIAFLMILLPLVYTLYISLTNYSSENLLTFKRATAHLLSQTYLESTVSYGFEVRQLDPIPENADDRPAGPRIQLLLNSSAGGDALVTPPLQLLSPAQFKQQGAVQKRVPLAIQPPISAHALTRKEWMRYLPQIKQLSLSLDTGQDLKLNGLRAFLPLKPRFAKMPLSALPGYQGPAPLLLDVQQQRYFAPNMQTGFYHQLDAAGQYTEQFIRPGFDILVGLANYKRLFTDHEQRRVLVKVLIWTLVFAVLSVALQFISGMTLACLLSWHRIQYRMFYRAIYILPFALPGFVSIMIFIPLFNPQHGDFNLFLNWLFGIGPDWSHNPYFARLKMLLVNIWLGFPYYMLVGMGMLKSISSDLYEAAVMDGASVLQKFKLITLPMVIKPMAPLLIASFAFNFNNFGIAFLLTGGGPQMADTSIDVGETDLLINYTYRLAFMSGTQDFGLSAVLSTLLFLIIGGIALWQFNIATEKQRQEVTHGHG